MIKTTARNATPQDLLAILMRQQEAKVDAIVPAQAITARNDGLLEVAGMGADGPEGPPAVLRPSPIMDADMAAALGIPVKYVRKLRAERPYLLAANYNEWLHGGVYGMNEDGTLCQSAPDGRNFLCRSFLDLDGGPGFGRALLSDVYRRIDHVDIMTGALQAVHETGVETEMVSLDLSEHRMSIKLVAPEIKVVAQKLLKGYKNPFADGYDGVGRYRPIRDGGSVEPIVNAGIFISNSETGGGAAMVKPWVQILVCLNGMTVTTDMFRAVHLGSRQEEGIIKVSAQSDQLNLALIKSQVGDAVRTYLDYDFLARLIEGMEEKATKKLDDPGKVVQVVGSALNFNEQEVAETLSLFIKGGQNTVGGIMQSVTALAQTVADPDRANEIEGMALQSLELAFAAA